MVTCYGEVDRYAQMMDRLPECDYQMNPEDLARLYTFLPEDVQKELNAGNTQQDTETTTHIVVWGGFFCVVLLGCVAGVILYRRKRK